MATRQLDTMDWGRSPTNKNQYSRTAKAPDYLGMDSKEFIENWLPRFESGELKYIPSEWKESDDDWVITAITHTGS